MSEQESKLLSIMKTEHEDSEKPCTVISDLVIGEQFIIKEEPLSEDLHVCDNKVSCKHAFSSIKKEPVYKYDKNMKISNLCHLEYLSNIKGAPVSEVTEDIVPDWKYVNTDNTESKHCKIMKNSNISDDTESDVSNSDDATAVAANDVNELKLHDKKKHVKTPKGNWSYCAICGLRFSTKQLLETHISLHSEEMFVTHKEDLELFLIKNNISNVKKQFDTKNFICNICCKHFSTKEKYFVHLLFHIDSKNVVCNVCNKSYLKTHWSSHMSTHDSEKYICDICGIRLLSKFVLLSHIKLHTEEQYLTHCDTLHLFIQNNFPRDFMRKVDIGNLICKVCNKTFSIESQFFLHIILHNDFRKYVCQICKRSFRSEGFFSRHLLLHNAVKKYTCYICNKKYLFKSTLSDHIDSQICIFDHECKFLNMSSADENELSKQCDICFRSQLPFDSLKNMRPRFMCHICQKIFKWKFKLSVHLLSHNEIGNYACDICNTSFKSKEGVRRHIKLHSGEKHVCDICEKSFKTKIELSRHSFCHSDVKGFVCPLCGKSYQRKEYLTKHLKTHSGVQNYTCAVCKKSFSQRGHLKSHLVSHNKIKRCYTCDLCNRSFTYLNHVATHLATCNTYNCQFCKKTFTHKFKLQSHLLVHSNVKQFSCEVCKKSYKTKKILSRHLKQVHFM